MTSSSGEGDDLAVTPRHDELRFGEALSEQGGENGDNGVLGGKMPRVDEVEAELPREQELMIFYVRRHIGITALSESVLYGVSSGSAHDGDPLRAFPRIVIAQPVRAEPAFAQSEEVPELHTRLQPPKAAAAVLVERAFAVYSEDGHKRVVHAACGDIEVRVHTYRRNAALRKAQGLPPGAGICHGAETAPDDRVVRYDELRVAVDGLLYDLVRDVERGDRPADLCSRPLRDGELCLAAGFFPRHAA